MADTAQEKYVLQADGQPHTSDVRFVSTSPYDPAAFFTASRDNTAKWNTIPESGDSVEDVTTFVGHTAFVNYVLYHPGIDLLDHEPCIVTGSNDQHIVLWSAVSSLIEAVLDGHSSGSCCGTILHFSAQSADADDEEALHGDIVSGDWSGTVIIFDHKSGRPKQIYDRHSNAIRGVAQLKNTTVILSGSGDKTVHAWDALTGRTIQIFSGHKDVVQCVCAIDSTRFASAGNDCTVHIWSLGSESPLQILEGHDSLIYCVCWSPSQAELYTASEDHTVRVWHVNGSDNKLGITQVIQHPCVVWSVAPTTDGRLISGGSDCVVRVWGRDKDRLAAEKMEVLKATISSQTIDLKVASSSGAAAAGAGLDVKSMPFTHEIANRKGSKEGERIFTRNEKGEVEVHMWNTGRWERVGVVVSGPDGQSYSGASQQQREKQLHDGQVYDYVFDVDVEGRMLRLPYNVGDSIVETAKRFIQDHAGVVAQDSQEEIQNFLMAHVAPEDLSHVPGLEGTRPNLQSGANAASSSPPPPPATMSTQYNESHTGDALLAPWESAHVFDTFNAAAALTKVKSLLPDRPELYHSLETLTPNLNDPSATCAALHELYIALPSGLRFPATDALRYILTFTTASSRIVGEILVRLASIWCPTGPPSQSAPLPPTTPAEWMVALRLAACVYARLCDAHFWTSSICEEIRAVLLWMVTALPSMTKLLTSDATPSMRANCRAATGALLRNVTVFLRLNETHVEKESALPVTFEESLVVAVVQHSAVLLLAERSDSPVVRDSLRSLRSLLSPVSPASPHRPLWRATAVAQMRKSLRFSLKAIATGARVEGQSTAAWLLAETESDETA